MQVNISSMAASRKMADRSFGCPAILYEGTSIDYRKLVKRTGCLAEVLATGSVMKGRQVAYLGLNSPTFLATYLACAWLGAVPGSSPLPWASTPPVSRRDRQPATGPRYPDRTHTAKQRRAYETAVSHSYDQQPISTGRTRRTPMRYTATVTEYGGDGRNPDARLCSVPPTTYRRGGRGPRVRGGAAKRPPGPDKLTSAHNYLAGARDHDLLCLDPRLASPAVTHLSGPDVGHRRTRACHARVRLTDIGARSLEDRRTP
jgi:hypothetical protein